MLPLTADVEGLPDGVPDAIVGVDSTGVIRFMNRQTELIFAYDPDDLMGRPVEVLVPESARPIHRVHREDYATDPRIRPMGSGLKLRGRRRDGTHFPIDVSVSHLDTRDGPLVIAALRDMTERELADQRHEQMKQLQAAIEFNGEAILSTTLDGIITSWNTAAEKLFGYRSHEIVGRSASVLSPRDPPSRTPSFLAKVRTGQDIENLKTLMVRKEGTALPVSLTVSAIFDGSGAVVGASVVPRDMTKAQESLQSARSMIESSLDSLVAISPQGKITAANQATVKITGAPREELIGTHFSRHLTDPEKANGIYPLVCTEGAAVDYPLTVRHRDGRLTEVLYNASVHRGSTGEVLGVFAAARDVTKQVQAQKKVAEQQAREQVRIAELERFQQMTIERALKVIELKKEIEILKGTHKPRRSHGQ